MSGEFAEWQYVFNIEIFQTTRMGKSRRVVSTNNRTFSQTLRKKFVAVKELGSSAKQFFCSLNLYLALRFPRFLFFKNVAQIFSPTVKARDASFDLDVA